MDRRAARFIGTFFILVLGFTSLVRITWVDQRVILPYTEFIAHLSGFALYATGISVQTEQTVIRHESFVVDIRRGCDGVVATLILLAAVLAYPSSWRAKAWGLSAGFLLIFLLNLVRVVGLFSLGVNGAFDLFEWVHTYVSQFAVIAAAMVFWVFWAGRQKTVSA